MTEKRFVFVGSGIEDNLTNDDYLCNKDGFQDICVELNELHEENQRLQGRIQEYEEQINQKEIAKTRRTKYDAFWQEKIRKMEARLMDKDELLHKQLVVNSNLSKRIRELEDD